MVLLSHWNHLRMEQRAVVPLHTWVHSDGAHQDMEVSPVLVAWATLTIQILALEVLRSTILTLVPFDGLKVRSQKTTAFALEVRMQRPWPITYQ